MLRTCVVVAMVSCGGPTIRELPRKPSTCGERWLTLDRDVTDLDLGADRVVWLEYEGGAIMAGGRNSEVTETLHASAPGVYATQLAVAGSKIAWAREDDGSIWKLDPGKQTQLATIKDVTQLEATEDAIVVGSTGGIHRLSWSGESEQVYSGEVWIMTVDGNTVYAHSNGKLMRISLDGQPPLVLADAPTVDSIAVHDGKVLITARHVGVLELAGDKLVPYAPLPLPTLIWNLRSANGQVYFTADNVVYQVRDKQPVPIAIAHEMIGDLEVDGEALYVESRERTGVRELCAKPVVLAKQDASKRSCAPGETEHERNDQLTFACTDAAGNRTYSVAFHVSGGVLEEFDRNGFRRTFYADGTPRSEQPHGKPGAEKHWFVHGKIKEEGLIDEAGAKHGTWRYWRPDGGVRDTIEWVHGKRAR